MVCKILTHSIPYCQGKAKRGAMRQEREADDKKYILTENYSSLAQAGDGERKLIAIGECKTEVGYQACQQIGHPLLFQRRCTEGERGEERRLTDLSQI